MDPITFLRQPTHYRRFLEYFLVAKSMKQEAAAEQHKERHQPNKFEQQASSWEQQAKKYFKIDQTGKH